MEIEALRRHLSLAVGELKNPIVLPESIYGGDEENTEASYEDGEGSRDYDSGVGDDDFEHDAWQADVDSLLQDLSLFKRKVADDKMRFPHPENQRPALAEIQGN